MNANDTYEYDPDDDVCHFTMLLRGQVGFGILLWLAIIFSLIAIILNILFARIVWRFTVYHINLRLLLVNLCAVVIWMCTGRLVKSAYIFFSLYTASDPCSFLVVKLSACKAISTLTVTHPSTVLLLGALGVGLERTYGLLRYRSYHKRTKRSLWLSTTILILAVWAPSLIPQVYSALVHTNNETAHLQIPLCLNLLTFKHKDAFVMLAAYSGAQVMSVVVWVLVYSLSRRLLTKISINRAQQSLAARFQLSQNFGVIRTLSPWIAAHFLFHSITLTIQWLIIERHLLTLDYASRVTLLYAVYMVQLTYAISFPLICVSRSFVLRKRLSKMIVSLKRLIGIGGRANIIQPDAVVRAATEIEKDGNTSNGFHLTDLKSLSATAAFSTPDKVGTKKRLQRIHVFSNLE